MTQNGVPMDTKFHGTIIDKLAKRGYWKEAKSIFSEIQNAGIGLDVHIYDVMLANTAKSGSFQECLRLYLLTKNKKYLHFTSLFQDMQEKKIYTANSFEIMVHVAAANKRWKECDSFMAGMLARHFVPTARTYTPPLAHAISCGNLLRAQQYLACVRAERVADQTLYHTTHYGLRTLLSQDKWRQIHPQVSEELRNLEQEMRQNGVEPPHNKPPKKNNYGRQGNVDLNIQMAPQTVHNMLDSL